MTTSSRGMADMGWAGVQGGRADGDGLRSDHADGGRRSGESPDRAGRARRALRRSTGLPPGGARPVEQGAGEFETRQGGLGVRFFWGALQRMARAPGGALLVTVGAVHALLALVLATWMLAPSEPLLGVHPALKPFKFAVSIGTYVLTMAWVLPRLTLGERVRLRVARLMAVTMVIEMVAILSQALRGVPSHFNMTSAWNGAIWNVMGAAITVASGVMVYLAWVAARRPLTEHDGQRTAPSLALALRGALILVATSTVSGFTMAKLMRHSVGGLDGGPGMPLTNWSTVMGDLRVAHFFQLHALQVLPLVALGVVLVTTKEATRLLVVRGAVGLYALLCAGTFAQALLGLPLFGA